jgi:hypothetical protein
MDAEKHCGAKGLRGLDGHDRVPRDGLDHEPVGIDPLEGVDRRDAGDSTVEPAAHGVDDPAGELAAGQGAGGIVDHHDVIVADSIPQRSQSAAHRP